MIELQNSRTIVVPLIAVQSSGPPRPETKKKMSDSPRHAVFERLLNKPVSIVRNSARGGDGTRIRGWDRRQVDCGAWMLGDGRANGRGCDYTII